MIKINLLPFRAARRKENIRRQISIFLLSFFLVFILMMLYHLNLSGKIKNLETGINDTNKELAKFDAINREITVIKKKLEVMNRKIQVIQTLDLNRDEPVRLLDAMTQVIVPKRMWFTKLEEKKLEASQENKADVISIEGFALDNNTVADFMTRLEKSKLFLKVNLITLKQDNKSTGLNLKSFQIDCHKPYVGVEAKVEQK